MTEYPVPDPIKPYMPIIVGAVLAIVILVAGWIASKWVHKLTVKILRSRHLDESLARFLASIAQYGVLAIAVIIALGKVGLETTSLVALLASAGLALGLALQGSLSHFASGVLLLLFRPFTIGDFVDAGGKTGTVEEIGLFATLLTTPENQRVTVPNGGITNTPITNYTVLGTRRASIRVGVVYGSDIDQVRGLLHEAITAIPEVLQEPAPMVLFMDLGASSLDFEVRVWATNEHFFPMQHDVRKAIYDKINGAGIEIPFNQIVVHQAAA